MNPIDNDEVIEEKSREKAFDVELQTKPRSTNPVVLKILEFEKMDAARQRRDIFHYLLDNKTGFCVLDTIVINQERIKDNQRTFANYLTAISKQLNVITENQKLLSESMVEILKRTRR